MSENTAGSTSDDRTANALLILRLTLGVFLFLWAIEKFVIPMKAIGLWKKFYFGVVDTETMTYVVGAILTIMSIAFIIGAYKRWVYLYGFVIHVISVVFTCWWFMTRENEELGPFSSQNDAENELVLYVRHVNQIGDIPSRRH